MKRRNLDSQDLGFSRRSPPDGRRPVRLPGWLWLCGLLLLVGWGARSLTKSAEARGVAVIDARRSLLQRADPWVLPEWEEALAHSLAQAGSLSARDGLAIADLVTEVAAHPFVAEVGSPEVVWPDGLLLPLRMRLPVACVRVDGGGYLPVSEDGIVLPGWSSAPHTAFGGWLPVLGPNEPALSVLLPGDRLSEPRHLDALAVAITMWNELAGEDLAALGRVLVDASREFAPDGLPGGVRIELELRRRVLFGRPPGTGHPGELPWEAKWRNVASGLQALRRGEDWDTWDARWDRPEPLRRPTPEEAAESEDSSAHGRPRDPGDTRVAGG